MTKLKFDIESLRTKARERTVKTQAIEYDLETLVKKITKNLIKLNPDYQRNHRWDEGTSSRLIESLILNIPIPVIYLSQDVDVDIDVDEELANDNGVPRYTVIDGQQRLTAIKEFMENKFPLKDLVVLEELNGAYHKDLPSFLNRRLEERTITCLRIDSTVDSQVKYDIFERLNSGSVKLSGQELRNASCRGPFKSMLKELCKNKNFIVMAKLGKDSSKVKKMEDEELVLRFFAIAYEDSYKEYKNGFGEFLTAKMTFFNKLDESNLFEMKSDFIEVMSRIRKSFGDDAFTKYKVVGGKLEPKSSFNAAVYDAVIYSFYKKRNKKGIAGIVDKNKFKNLFKDQDFFSSVEGSVNDFSKIKLRIERAAKL